MAGDICDFFTCGALHKGSRREKGQGTANQEKLLWAFKGRYMDPYLIPHMKLSGLMAHPRIAPKSSQVRHTAFSPVMAYLLSPMPREAY